MGGKSGARKRLARISATDDGASRMEKPQRPLAVCHHDEGGEGPETLYGRHPCAVLHRIVTFRRAERGRPRQRLMVSEDLCCAWQLEKWSYPIAFRRGGLDDGRLDQRHQSGLAHRRLHTFHLRRNASFERETKQHGSSRLGPDQQQLYPSREAGHQATWHFLHFCDRYLANRLARVCA